MYHRQEILISVTINDKSPLQVYEKGPHETEFKILFKKKKGNKQAKSLAKDTKKWWKYLLGNRTDQLFSTWRIIKTVTVSLPFYWKEQNNWGVFCTPLKYTDKLL